MMSRSNLLWCPDRLRFTCLHSKVARSAFIIDAHKREVYGCAVSKPGVSSSGVRNIMPWKPSFSGMRAITPVEMLSDNGSVYTASETRGFARQLGLEPCFTPARLGGLRACPHAKFMNAIVMRAYFRASCASRKRCMHLAGAVRSYGQNAMPPSTCRSSTRGLPWLSRKSDRDRSICWP